MPEMHPVSIKPARNILGSLRVPGDKSISHRYAMLAALAAGRSRLDNFAPGADCASTLRCVRALGCKVERDDKGAVVIDGLGPHLHAPHSPLDCGNSGSTMRMMSGILAAQSFSSELLGDESLSRRPMQRVIEPRFTPMRTAHRCASTAQSCTASTTHRRWPARRSRLPCCSPGCWPRVRRR